MPLFGNKVKPVSIVAFILTCFGCLLALIAISLTNWWSVNSSNARTYHGVWSRQDCKTSAMCQSGSATTLQGGHGKCCYHVSVQEFVSISIIKHCRFSASTQSLSLRG